jgi:hypothetical protein
MQAANAAFGEAIRRELQRQGIESLPGSLDFARRPVPERIERDTLLTQVCGYPLQTIYRGQATGSSCRRARGGRNASRAGSSVSRPLQRLRRRPLTRLLGRQQAIRCLQSQLVSAPEGATVAATGHCIQLRTIERAVIFEVRGLFGRTEVQRVHDFSPSAP